MSDVYRVTSPHVSDYPDPIELAPGDLVSYERRPSEWPGWLWCTNDTGARGWVPEAYLLLDVKTATATRRYTARELSAEPGDVLTGSVVESGWLWATAPSGASGWIPLNVLEEISP